MSKELYRREPYGILPSLSYSPKKPGPCRMAVGICIILCALCYGGYKEIELANAVAAKYEVVMDSVWVIHFSKFV